jgi:hypothetical protein
VSFVPFAPDDAPLGRRRLLARLAAGGTVAAAGLLPAAWVSPIDPGFGARGDGRHDDTAALQKAHDAIVATGARGVMHLPAGIYRITRGLVLDARFVTLVADGATIEASALESGAALTVTGSGATPYVQSLTSISGLRLAGGGSDRPTVGVRFDRPRHQRPETGGPSHLALRNCNVAAFGVGYCFENHAYNVELYTCDAYDCGTCLRVPSGTHDSGERIVCFGGTYFNSRLAVENANPNCMVDLVGCSLDYNRRQIDLLNGRMTLTSCHVEAGDYPEAPLRIRGDGASLVVMGGWMTMTGTGPRSAPAIVECDMPPHGGGGVLLQGVFLSNLMTRDGADRGPRFAIGGGPVRLAGVQSYGIGGNPRIVADAASRLRDGGFDRAQPADPVLLADTRPVRQRLAGRNATLERVADAGHRAPGALRLRKRGGAGTPAAFAFIVPLAPGQTGDFELFCRSTPRTEGVVYLSCGYGVRAATRDGVPGLETWEETAGWPVEVARPASRDGWLRIASGEPTRCAPGWADCFVVVVNAAAMSAGDFLVDDAVVTVLE